MAIISGTVVEGSRRIATRLLTRGPVKEALGITISGIRCPGSPRDKYHLSGEFLASVFRPSSPPSSSLSSQKRMSPFSSFLVPDHLPNSQQNMSESFGFQAEISQLLDLIISALATFSV